MSQTWVISLKKYNQIIIWYVTIVHLLVLYGPDIHNKWSKRVKLKKINSMQLYTT